MRIVDFLLTKREKTTLTSFHLSLCTSLFYFDNTTKMMKEQQYKQPSFCIEFFLLIDFVILCQTKSYVSFLSCKRHETNVMQKYKLEFFPHHSWNKLDYFKSKSTRLPPSPSRYIYMITRIESFSETTNRKKRCVSAYIRRNSKRNKFRYIKDWL
jgi:hypothetical protein